MGEWEGESISLLIVLVTLKEQLSANYFHLSTVTFLPTLGMVGGVRWGGGVPCINTEGRGIQYR